MRARLNTLYGWFLWFSLAVAGAVAQEQTPLSNLSSLQEHLTAVVNATKYQAAFWGVKIVSLDTGKTLFEHNAQKLFSPASNSKLYTVALALDRFGADYRLKTSLYAQNRPNRRGVLDGDLVVYGRGDPTLNARLHHGDVYEALEPLVAALTNAGVKTIKGDLVGDESFFQGPEFGSGWMWDDMEYEYGAEISALTINDNVVPVKIEPADRSGVPCRLTPGIDPCPLTFSNRSVTVEKEGRRTLRFYRPLDGNLVYVSGQIPLEGAAYEDSLPMHRPAAWFMSLFREALRRHGIKVKGQSRVVNWLDRQGMPLDCSRLVELAWVESPPLRDIAREILKPSQNLYTDLLLAQVGESVRAAATTRRETSEDLGIAELQEFLKETGVKEGEVLFEEGSGLSRDNLTTPNATVALLTHMSRHKCAEPFVSALPVAGQDGTLRNRMKGTVAAGNVRAKTGTLRWANSLSGYVQTAAGERLVFSLMLNRFHGFPGASAGRADLDAIAVLLAGFNGRSAE